MCGWTDVEWRHYICQSHSVPVNMQPVLQCSGKTVSSFSVVWRQGLSCWLLSTAAYLRSARGQQGRSTVRETKVISLLSLFPALPVCLSLSLAHENRNPVLLR